MNNMTIKLIAIWFQELHYLGANYAAIKSMIILKDPNYLENYESNTNGYADTK